MGLQGGAFLRLAYAAALVTACGKVDNDASVDAGADADQGGDATVVTQAALFGSAVGAKVGGIDIVSNLPNGKVLATGKTDDNGNATIRVYPGGSVTAIYKHAANGGSDVMTWGAVKPGDTLTFGERQLSTNGVASTSLGAQTYTFPTSYGAATYVYVYTSCSSSGTPIANGQVSVTEYSGCHQDPMDLLFYAYDGTGFIGYGSRQNLTFAAGSTVALGNFTAAQQGSINITGLPTDITSVNGQFRSVIDGKNEVGAYGSFGGTPTGGAYTKTFPWFPLGERTVGTVSINRPGYQTMTILDSFSAGTTTQTVAMPTAVPWMQCCINASTALRRANWFAVPDSAAVVDGQLVTLSWSHQVEGKDAYSQWYFILPPGQNELELPELPAALATVTPPSTSSFYGQVRQFDISTVNGFDALRGQPAGNIQCLECSVRGGDYQRVIVTSDFSNNF